MLLDLIITVDLSNLYDIPLSNSRHEFVHIPRRRKEKSVKLTNTTRRLELDLVEARLRSCLELVLLRECMGLDTVRCG